MASVCRELDLDVTVAERGEAPLVGALGGVIGRIAAEMHRDHDVDLRTGVSVTSLKGDANGHVRSATLSDGTTLDVEAVVAALGSIRNVEWLEGSGLAAGQWGVGCDAGCRAFDIHGVITDSIYVAGDVARAPHVLYDYQFLAMEHWDNAMLGAEVAAHNMVASSPTTARICCCPASGRASSASTSSPSVCRPSPTRSSSPRGRSRTAASSPPTAVGADRRRRQLRRGQVAGVLRRTDREVGSVPAATAGVGPARRREPIPAEFPAPGAPTAMPEVVLTGHNPSERRAEFRPRRR